jgi:predicted HD superfamily hydrolase involved in NAD metabolism
MGPTSALTPDLVRERLQSELDDQTLAHTERVAELAVKLANQHGVDPERAEIAALVHDIADNYSDQDLQVLAKRYGLDVHSTEARIPKLLHARVGAEILRREWGITDEELLDAVRNHITGGVHMSPLAKVLFVADKLEPERDRHYGGLDPIRELAMVNLDAAMLKLYAWRMDELIAADRPVHPTFVEARNQLIEQTLASDR